ncbi:MAG: hypothetical protein IJH40_06740 [Ruminococcus sp.]|uniref:hypothetical protein n=1 Tax=Ruminococcus sp. TaxID=41978 RepID=UPI002872E282|nr:hypothetical protein [Ruminococcus sp.]MBQ3285324.1 hypothetical protein [Ruminococcus sp.]
MKNPFKRFRSSREKEEIPQQEPQTEIEEPAPQQEEPTVPPPEEKAPADDFVEWCRSQVHGGIERRERNDIFEEYSVYGTNGKGRLICRRWHRYPEHERDFGLAYSRDLSFDEFNRRLLSELDKGDMKLSVYNECIEKAALLTQIASQEPPFEGFSESEAAALKAFCEALDTLTDKEYLRTEGTFCCSCRSVVGDERLSIRFRKPLPHDALFTEAPGVSRKPVEGYEIESLWIMGVANRLGECCQSRKNTLLTSEWSLNRESVYLMRVEGFPDIDGVLLAAVADEAAFPHFGFYSLDFSQ